jgi:hypothetical protein
MTTTEYYHLLGLPVNASIDEIKRAYRQKARLYHPDLNHSPEAKDLFIKATEAYEFLISHYGLHSNNDEAFRQAMEDWRKYRQDRSRMRANAYARASYIRFKQTKFYKTTRILDGTSIIFGLFIAIAVICYAVFGYFYRLKHPLPDEENPTIIVFLMFLSIGMIFFVVSMVYLKAYIDSSKNRKKKSK